MWRKILHDVGLKAVQAGVKEALTKIDGAIEGPPLPREKVVIDVLCKNCKRVRGREDGAFCSGCGRPYAGTT
jgi:hypothetical protein